MEEEHRGIALVILGIIAVIAVIGLVLMFTNSNRSAGALFTNTGVTPGIVACDSPCTLFPSGNDYDAMMMEDRVDAANRKWIYVGDVTFTYIIDGRTEVLGCWCPTQGSPQFPPTEEFASIIPGESSGPAQYAGRYPGTPVDMYSDISYPAAPRSDPMGTPPGYYPLGTNTIG